jgi:hypothetical protein
MQKKYNTCSLVIAAIVCGLASTSHAVLSSTPVPAPMTPTAVPEAPTIIAGALLALPFGLCALRSMRKSKD